MTSERRVYYVDVSKLTEHDVRQVREQISRLGAEHVLVLRERAWVAFLLGAFVGALVLAIINALR